MVKIFTCGDIVNYTNVDGTLLSDELEKLVVSADYSICNFEAPIQGHGLPQLKSGPHHAQQPLTLEGLKKQGFNLALLANNHMLDYGREGLEATLNTAHSCGLETIGAGIGKSEAYQPLIKEFNGVKIGIINAGEAQFGVLDHSVGSNVEGYAWINHSLIDKTILDLKRSCDFVLVFVHAGLENYSIPQKEWRERYKHLCDLGADAIIGSHPHVPQGYEKYGSSLIFYSLGNFYFDGGRSVNSENKSFALMLTLEKGRSITFEPVFHYTKNHRVECSPLNKTINLEDLCSLLDEGYDLRHKKMVMDTYPKFRNRLVFSLTNLPIDKTLKGTVREIVLRLLGRPKDISKTLTSLHLTRNEAYYYVMKNALEIELAEKKKK